MKKYIKEIIICAVQLFMFYVFPLFAGPTDAMGMVVLIIIATTLLSLILALISKEKLRFIYPAVTAVVFIPSVFIHYGGLAGGAIVHSLWYLVVSSVGMAAGTVMRLGVKAIVKAVKSQEQK